MKKIKLPGPKFKITSGIYLITCLPTKDTYIGKSKNLNQRWCQHRSDLKSNKHNNPHLQALYNTHGPKAFTMELIELVEDKGSLETREAFYINTMSPNLNVVDTKLSKNDADEIKRLVATEDLDTLCLRFNISLKYLKEILRGDKWKQSKINL